MCESIGQTMRGCLRILACRRDPSREEDLGFDRAEWKKPSQTCRIETGFARCKHVQLLSLECLYLYTDGSLGY
jgi:hypothetical protein